MQWIKEQTESVNEKGVNTMFSNPGPNHRMEDGIKKTDMTTYWNKRRRPEPHVNNALIA